MIGVLFLFCILIWFVVIVSLSKVIPRWIGIKSSWSRVVATLLLFAVIFVAPVSDEIVAYPQMMALCESIRPYELASGMDEKTVYGRTVYHKQSSTREALWPQTVEVTRWTSAYIDEKTKEPILVQSWLEPQHGMLGVPNGSSGGQMTVLLKKCSPKYVEYDSEGRPIRFSQLNLTEIPTP